MNSTYVVIPVWDNAVDLTDTVNKLKGGYVAPETYEKQSFNFETKELTTEEVAHPYAGQTGPDFTGKIVVVNFKPGYTAIDGVTHLEYFDELNVYKAWNMGIAHAEANGAHSILVLNSVVDFDPFAVKDAYDLMNNENTQVVNIADGAIILFAAASTIKPDDQFKIWFGDNDIFRRAGALLSLSRSEYINVSDKQAHVHDAAFDAVVKEDEVKYNAKSY